MFRAESDLAQDSRSVIIWYLGNRGSALDVVKIFPFCLAAFLLVSRVFYTELIKLTPPQPGFTNGLLFLGIIGPSSLMPQLR